LSEASHNTKAESGGTLEARKFVCLHVTVYGCHVSMRGVGMRVGSLCRRRVLQVAVMLFGMRVGGLCRRRVLQVRCRSLVGTLVPGGHHRMAPRLQWLELVLPTAVSGGMTYA
jgi:hypothetical protein